jgi:hypothetical protein
VYVQTMSETQRQFITAAESLGALSPAAARTSVELPRLSARELTELLDSGIVREAAQGAFYVYPRARPPQPLQPTPSRSAATPSRRVKAIIFWLIVLALPLLFLLLRSTGGR